MPGLLAKLKNKHFLSLAGNIIMSGFGMLVFAILYHSLSPEQMGIWIFFQANILLLDNIRSGFITNAFIKFYAGAATDRANEVTGSTWCIAIGITAVLVLLNIPGFFFMQYVSNPALQLFIKWVSITYVCTLPYFMAMCVSQAEQRFDRLLFIRFVNQFLFMAWIFTLIFLHKITLQNVVYANIGSSLFTSIISLLTGFARIGSFRYSTKSGLMQIFNFGKYSVGSTLGSSLFRVSDNYIITFMLGPAGLAALAAYNLGGKFMELVEIPLRSLVATAMPSLAGAYNRNNKEEVIYIFKKYAGTLTLLLVPACIIAVLLADFAITLIGGGQYAGTKIGVQAANVFRLFMTFALLFPADRFLAVTLDAIHQPQINFIKVLVMLAANIIGDVVGILLLHNIYGVAFTTVIPIIIGASIGYYALRKYQPFAFFDIYRFGYAEVMQFIKLYWLKLRGSKV